MAVWATTPKATWRSLWHTRDAVSGCGGPDGRLLQVMALGKAKCAQKGLKVDLAGVEAIKPGSGRVACRLAGAEELRMPPGYRPTADPCTKYTRLIMQPSRMGLDQLAM
jgi:hypothetical protein